MLRAGYAGARAASPMPNAFSRIADELDPAFVQDWASRYRRRVPSYAERLLAMFGPWWLPRLGLSLLLLGLVVEVASMIVFIASKSWVVATLTFFVGFLTTFAGSLMWTSYRVRHWLPGGAASSAPLAPPAARRLWPWSLLAFVVTLGGIGLMMWLISADGSPRAVALGAGLFMVCASTAAAAVVRQSDSISPGRMKFAGLPARRVSLAILIVGLVLAAALLAQAPFLPGSR